MTLARSLSNLSLFTGAGGMELGLESAGFSPVACIELDGLARETIRLNRPSWNLLDQGDVNEVAEVLTPSSLDLVRGELDLISGGPPCQPFSSAAQWAPKARRGMEDLRANTIHSLITLVDSFLPKAVLIENVQGFVQGEGSALSTIQAGMTQINKREGTSYSPQWQLLNSADFGVPQNRRRIILIAFRDDAAFTWPELTHETNPVSAGEAFAGLPAQSTFPARGKWAGLLKSIPAGMNYQWLTEKGGGEEVFGHRTKYWNFLLKLSPTSPSWTLAATPGPSTGPFHWDNRPLTSQEMLRLQTFPDGWQLAGDARQQTKLAGNATPALLAEVMGRAIRRSLDGGASLPSHPELTLERTDAIPSAPAPVPVPMAYSTHLGPKAAHPGTGKGPASVTRTLETTVSI